MVAAPGDSHYPDKIVFGTHHFPRVRPAYSMYNQLPQAAFTADELVDEDMLQTALGLALDMDYSLRFQREEGGSVRTAWLPTQYS